MCTQEVCDVEKGSAPPPWPGQPDWAHTWGSRNKKAAAEADRKWVATPGSLTRYPGQHIICITKSSGDRDSACIVALSLKKKVASWNYPATSYPKCWRCLLWHLRSAPVPETPHLVVMSRFSEKPWGSQGSPFGSPNANSASSFSKTRTAVKFNQSTKEAKGPAFLVQNKQTSRVNLTPFDF